MKNDRAVGQDGIPAQALKLGDDKLRYVLLGTCLRALEEGKVPQAWKDVDIKLLHKGEDKEDFAKEFLCLILVMQAKLWKEWYWRG